MTSNSLLLGSLKAAISPSGRATRAEFWEFAPFELSLCVITGFGATLLDFTFMGVVLSVFTASLPLVALWWRRLQDVGVWGGHPVYPWLALLIFFLCISAAHALQTEASDGFRRARSLLFGWAMMPEILFKFVGGKWIALLIAAISLITFLFRFVFSLSHAMLHSEQKANRYGPNPNEVTP